MDMSKFIVAKSDQLNSDDLMGGPRTITITNVRGAEGDQPVAVHYENDDGKPFKPCKSMRRVMVACWGKNAAEYAGRSMTLYRDPEVAFGGMKVGGIRISHMSHIDAPKQMALTATRGKKAPYKVLPLKDAPQQQAQQQGSDDEGLALAALTEAASRGSVTLENAWKQKWMGPHREALQLELERLKLIAAANDRTMDEPSSQQTTGGYDGV